MKTTISRLEYDRAIQTGLGICVKCRRYHHGQVPADAGPVPNSTSTGIVCRRCEEPAASVCGVRRAVAEGWLVVVDQLPELTEDSFLPVGRGGF